MSTTTVRADVVTLLGPFFNHALDDLADEDDRDFVARLCLLAHAAGKREGRLEALVERLCADRLAKPNGASA